MYHYNKQLKEEQRFEVIVVGSGSSGSIAAIACAREGVKTLLIEKMPFLGGTSTAVLDTFYGFYTPGKNPRKVVGGIADEVISELKKFKMCFERPNTQGKAGTAVTYHPEYLKVVWENMVRESGCNILLNGFIQDVIMEDGKVAGLIVATKEGLRLFKTLYVIDATGDADICYYAGYPFEQAGAIDSAQTLTTTFKMVNVDNEKRSTIPKSEINRMMVEAANTGRYVLPRKEGSDHITPVENMRATIMTRLKASDLRDGKVINATDPLFLSEVEMIGRLQALEYIRFLKDYVPGYAHSELSTFSFKIGVRETRRIYGEYRLNREDVLSAQQFEDQIGLCGAPIEDHHEGEDTEWGFLPEGKCVGIPYRALVPKDSKNILVCGRCFSADHVAHTSVRSMAQCMAMGEAAGTAIALSSKKRINPLELDIKELQKILKNNGAILK